MENNFLETFVGVKTLGEGQFPVFHVLSDEYHFDLLRLSARRLARLQMRLVPAASRADGTIVPVVGTLARLPLDIGILVVFIDKHIEIVRPVCHHLLELLEVGRAALPRLLQDSLQQDDILPGRTLQDVNLDLH